MEQLIAELFTDKYGPEIDLSKQQIVRPFQYQTGFIPVDLAEFYHYEKEAIVLCSRFQNRGLHGVIAAYTRFFHTGVPESTPMGHPDFHFEWLNGIRVPVNPPLTISMIFALNSAQDHDILRRHYHQFIFGPSTYFMFNQFQIKPPPTIVMDGEIYNNQGDADLPILPYSLNALKDIRVIAVSTGPSTKFDVRRVGNFEYAIEPLD